MITKPCKQCNQDFTHNTNRKVYCSKYCRNKAERTRRKEYIQKYMQSYNRDLEKHRAYNRKYNYKFVRKQWGKKIIPSIKSRCLKKGIDFNIEASDLKVPKKCPVLNIPIIIGNDNKYNSPTVDRIDNSKGYVKGNIWVISHSANSMKSDMPLSVWTSFYESMRGKWRL